jgi:4-oxalocrotonate tautomerase
MPHVIVKVVAGKTELQKQQLAEEITRRVMDVLQYGEESVSVAIEEVKLENWARSVYNKDIVPHWEKLYKKPGYGPM